jgi:hypothetical protein
MSNFKLAAVTTFVGAISLVSPQGAEAQSLPRANAQGERIGAMSVVSPQGAQAAWQGQTHKPSQPGVNAQGERTGAISLGSPQGPGAPAQPLRTKVQVERTNVQVNGVFVPAFVVNANGVLTTHLVGRNGLTRKMFFDPAAAAAFLSSRLGVRVEKNNVNDISRFQGKDQPPVKVEQHDPVQEDEDAEPVQKQLPSS